MIYWIVFFVFFCLIRRKIVGDDCFDTFSRKKDATLSVSSESRLTNVRDLRFLYLTGMFICLENMKDEQRQSFRFYFLIDLTYYFAFNWSKLAM